LAVGTQECYYDDMRLYNRVLSVKDIIRLMNEEENLNLPLPNLALWLDAANFMSYQNLSDVWNAKNGSEYNVFTTDCSYVFTTPPSMLIGANTGKMSYPFSINDPSGSTFFFVIAISEIPTGNSYYSLLSPEEKGLDIRLQNGLEIGYSVNTYLNNGNITEPVYDISFTPHYSYNWPELQTNTTYLLTIQTNPFLIRINGKPIISNIDISLNIPDNSNILYSKTNMFGPNNPGNMNVNEFIYYRQTISNNMYSQIEGYLAWKWNLETQLSSNHPFITAPVIYANANY
jgi:hypothetical protein